jgi:hypothetical protein
MIAKCWTYKFSASCLDHSKQYCSLKSLAPKVRQNKRVKLRSIIGRSQSDECKTDTKKTNPCISQILVCNFRSFKVKRGFFSRSQSSIECAMLIISKNQYPCFILTGGVNHSLIGWKISDFFNIVIRIESVDD